MPFVSDLGMVTTILINLNSKILYKILFIINNKNIQESLFPVVMYITKAKNFERKEHYNSGKKIKKEIEQPSASHLWGKPMQGMAK